MPRYILMLLLLVACNRAPENAYDQWPVYNGSKAGLKYSALQQIDTSNVSRLRVAWEYHAGDADSAGHSQIQCNPVMVNGVLYVVSPQLKLIALDAATGQKKWLFDPWEGVKKKNINSLRGVTYWEDEKEQRIFYTAGPHLYAVNALDGSLVKGFGDSGRISLHNGLGENAKDLYVVTTSPGIIYKNQLIIGSRVSEGADAAPGHIRSYDVRSGKLRWTFHTIPQPGEPGYEDWNNREAYKHLGGANAWSGFSLDEEKGILYAPLGSVSFDFYGGMRKGANLYGNSLLALDAATGKRIWHFQSVHHDVWDRDLPAPPVLVTVTHEGKKKEAVAQVTKTGFVFLLDRTTGQPLFPVEERPVPAQSTLKGEQLWPTQPYPALPAPFVRQSLTEADLNYLLPDSSLAEVKRRWLSFKHSHMFEPPSKEGTVIFPGFDGGAEWGGPAVDPETGILYVNASEMPWVLQVIDAPAATSRKETNLQAGKRIYRAHCMSCHGAEREGGGAYPALRNVHERFDTEQFLQLLSTGRRMMPAFNGLQPEEKNALATFVLDLEKQQPLSYKGPQQQPDSFRSLPYTMTGYNKFLSKEGLPANSPPWGTLTAIDLNTGKFVWKDTLGEDPAFKGRGVKTGTENYGAPVVTAGGLLFIAATKDAKIRAFNKRNGQLLWEAALPASGFATPAVYRANGKQYVVIACGGGKLNTPSGDSYVAFALP
ncbi:PQQ-binding-like beta-propeller repeat protein [Chitinophaga sp. GCM10012297]|uniref:PQQ-binding-like beta-propeller repeat protein n=1 Tax=Chitinophaga chungangae TaxID=2821488 RepID=A0ABS3YJD1_9BACT|nr:PQQ-binding-like beta-propeller repeat protein [Chitinophaga chungangae]MBO9154790.1 PQQ-binding-like beta-propeller repeat protein [Chitinophaga chungangae]